MGRGGRGGGELNREENTRLCANNNTTTSPKNPPQPLFFKSLHLVWFTVAHCLFAGIRIRIICRSGAVTRSLVMGARLTWCPKQWFENCDAWYRKRYEVGIWRNGREWVSALRETSLNSLTPGCSWCHSRCSSWRQQWHRKTALHVIRKKKGFLYD